MRLSDVLARRRVLAPAEVVTLVVGVALELAELHGDGRSHGAVGVGAVWFEPDGRPRLFSGPGGQPASDLHDLAALGHLALGDRRAPRLVRALEVRPGDDARTFADRVLGCGPAAPMQLTRRESRSPRWRGAVALGAVALAVGALTLLRPPTPARWAEVLAALDRARFGAISDRDASGLTAVYAPGSSQLARDTELIRRLSRGGLRLRGRLAELTDPTAIGPATLAAVERPAGYVVVDRRGHVVLRVDGARPRRVVVRLRHTKDGWRVVDVS